MSQARFFLILTVFLGLVIIGFLLAFSANLLSPSTYSVFYSIQKIFTSQSSTLPYLQKFEGHWTVTLDPSIAESDLAACASRTGTVVVRNGVFSGSVGPLGDTLSIHASVLETGTVTGTLAEGAHTGNFDGAISGESGSGTWSDSLDCSGTIAFVKLEPVVDPVAGHIVSVTGDVNIIRNGQAAKLFPEQLVYAGDLITLSPGSNATLVLGLRSLQVTLAGNSTYTVPDNVGNQ